MNKVVIVVNEVGVAIMGEFIETAFLLSIVGTFCLGAFFICMTALAVLDSTPSDTVMSDTIIADTSQQSPTTNEPVTLGDISKPTYKFSEPVSSTDVEYEGADGHTISFAHNSSAVNPTYEQVISFLKSDTTDQIPYDLNKFTCGDYAEHVQHNAEATGYRCGWVFIELDNGNHACNAFDTMDRGIVFVDSTIFDSVVDLKEGYEYQPIPLSKLLGYNSGVSADSMGVVKSYHIEW